MLMLLSAVIVVSCGSNDDKDSVSPVSIDTHVESLSSVLFGTSWQHYKSILDNGLVKSACGITITFSSKLHDNPSSRNGHQTYTVGVNGFYDEKQASWWYIDDTDGFYCHFSQILYAMGYTAFEVGGITALIPLCGSAQIYKQTSSELVIKHSTSYGDTMIYFKRVEDPSNSGDSSDDSGSSSTTEKPDIGFYDFTATKTSLKVQYQIYNKAEAGVTSAKIYYGTSSNPTSSKTATVSGTMITSTISGLKAGTTYYVKCSATGKGGTTTTSTTKCITNY